MCKSSAWIRNGSVIDSGMNKFVRFIHNAVAGNKLAMRLAFLPFIWMPMIVGVFLKENLENRLLHYCLFAVLYLIGFTILYFFFKLIVSGRSLQLQKAAMVLVILLMQNIIMILLFNYKISVSIGSLLLAALLSLVITLVCVCPMLTKAKVLNHTD